MRVFFNHIHKTGGTSLESLFENDSNLKFIRVKANSSADDLQEIANNYSEGNMIVQGHLNEPFYLHCPHEIRIKFWDFIYKISDIKFSILRHPIDRALSYIRYSGFKDSDSIENLDPNFFYKYIPWPGDNYQTTKLFEIYKRFHMQVDSTGLSLLENILPNVYSLHFPECLNLALAMNEYPIALFSSLYAGDFLIPNSLREQKFSHESYFKNFYPMSNYIFENLKIPEIKLLAFEDLEFVIQWLKQQNIINGNMRLPHLNRTKLHNSVCDNAIMLKDLKCSLEKEYPESFILWKLAAMRLTLNK